MTKKRSDKWPERHASSLEKWNKIVEKTEAGEDFSNKVMYGFSDLPVWTTCGYCEELNFYRLHLNLLYFNLLHSTTCFCCLLNQRKIIWEGKKIPICNRTLISMSVASTFVNEMISSNPDREKAIKLAKIVRDEIAKDKPE